MITEDYVSFEIAKLLKEKRFDTPVWTRYENNGDGDNEVIFGDKYNWNNSPMGQISAPTLQMAMKWLREVHSLHIWIGHAAGKGLSWYYEIHGISDGKVKHIGGIQCGSYEVACESALKYCLEHLI